MTEESKKILVEKLKQKLNITWNDEKTDRKLSDIVSDAEAGGRDRLLCPGKRDRKNAVYKLLCLRMERL